MANLTPRNALQTPLVEARSKALITLETTYAGYNPLTTSPADALNSLQFVGNVEKIMLPNKRGASERRELNSATVAEIKEIIPGLVDFEGMEFQNVITYGQDFLSACGFTGGIGTDWQAFPLIFVLTLPTPDASVFPVQTFMITKAWILNNPYQWDVTEKVDLRITQRVEIRAANIIPITIPS